LLAGKLDLALPLFEETLRLRKARLGPEHPHTLASMHNLATAYLEAGKLELALPLFEQTLQLTKARLGPEHPDTLTSMCSLAEAYRAAGKLDLALPLFEQTFQLRKARLGPEHPDTHRSMNDLAAAYWSAKQLDKSIPLFEETLKRQEAKLGRDHPDTLLTVANLGVNYKDAGRLEEALPLLEEAYRAAKKYPDLRFVGPPLLDAYTKAGATAKLASLLQEQLPEIRQALPKDSPQLASLLAQLSLALLQQNKGAEAEPLLRECLAIRQKTLPDHWLTFNTQAMLGGALLQQKKYTDAEPLLLAGYQGMKKHEAQIPPQGKVRLTEAVQRLVQLYEETGNQDEAARWRKELEANKTAQKKDSKK
jgi:tetratricopeptide (TPR) repeat protein